MDSALRHPREGLAMGWVERRGRRFRLSFGYGGEVHRHSLEAEDQRETDECLSLAERNLRLPERGVPELPPGADLALFLLSSGRRAAKPTVPGGLSLLECPLDRSIEAHRGASEEITSRTSRIHAKHLKGTFGPGIPIRTLANAGSQRHIGMRSNRRSPGPSNFAPSSNSN
jgi:hypothetical protein